MLKNKMELFHKKFKCEKCGGKFKTQDELDEHVKTHVAQQSQESQQTVPGNDVDQQPQQNQTVK